jgi:peptidoglycan hydrolase CwlO-like protein
MKVIGVVENKKKIMQNQITQKQSYKTKKKKLRGRLTLLKCFSL